MSKGKLTAKGAIFILFLSLCLTGTILTKFAVHFTSIPFAYREKVYPIRACNGLIGTRTRYVTKDMHSLYYGINNLLTPVLLFPFALLAYKTTKRSSLLQVETKRRKNVTFKI